MSEITGNDQFSIAGKILRVNLSNGEVRTEPSGVYIKEWLGGSGSAVKILYDELRSWVTPYEPANKLIFSVGTLIGTSAPGACKMNVSTLGPVTGGWASSCCDSYFGAQLKYAGYDILIIEGKARCPVYLWIHDEGKVEILGAEKLWGKTTWKTLDEIRNSHDDNNLHILSIGPAGENLARGACIIQDTGRAMGRCGTGSVMGSKNLKAIVARGSGSIKIAQPDRFLAAVRTSRRIFKDHPATKIMRKYGALCLLPPKQACSGINFKNFQESTFPDDAADRLDPRHQVDAYEVKKQSFPGCGLGGCSRWLHFTEGTYAGLECESCQWEAISTLQGRFGILDEPAFAFKANALCNEYGLDIDSAGGAISWAMECYQRGIIDETKTDGLKIKWGDAGVALELIRKMAYREGFGNILAEGSARAAEILGLCSDYYAIHMKKQDLYENIRGAMAWGLGTTTATRGGGHTTGAVWFETTGLGPNVEKAQKIYGVDNEAISNPLAYDGKAKMVTYQEILHRVINCLGICIYNTITFNMDFLDLPEIAEFYSAATGWETSVDDFKKIAMRQLNLEKAFNLRFTDFDRKDDMPPSRELLEPIATGPLAGWAIDEEKWNNMLDEYYDLHGWDRATSYPTRETLVSAGLDYVADELQKIGKLG